MVKMTKNNLKMTFITFISPNYIPKYPKFPTLFAF